MSTTHILDHRRVQTAVIGDKNSDHPVILPMDAHELDLWRRAHPNYSYWCGNQLGGCGGELSDRRYTKKVCHFAHHASTLVCHRTANDESSADHLFIKRGVQRLLDKQQVRGKVQTQDLGTGPGDAVDVYLPHTSRLIRFQLGRCDYPAWRREADTLRPKASGGIDWVFGTDGPATRELRDRDGYSLRVRLETVGGERYVHIGTEARDRSISWTPLGDCALTPTGLTTPHVETIRLSRPRPKLPAFPLAGGLVFKPVPEAKAPSASPFTINSRRLLIADVKPVDGPIVRALLSLPGDTDAPPSDHVYRVPDSARILVLEDSQGWAVEANRYVRLNAHEAQRTGLWTPPPGSQTDPTPPTPAPTRRAEKHSPSTATAPQPNRPVNKATAKSQPHTHTDLVTEVRDALADFARHHSTTTWNVLARRLGPDLAALSDTARRDLLVEVDTPPSEYLPVRSALILHGAGPLPYLGEILDRLRVPHPNSPTRLRQWAVVERERAYAAYAQPSRAMPPRPTLSPTQPVQPKQLAQALNGRMAPPNSALARRAPVVTVKRQDERISNLIAELRDFGLIPDKAIRRQVNRAVLGAEVWLGDKPAGYGAKRVRAAGQSREHHIRTLERALTAVRTRNSTHPDPGTRKPLSVLQAEFLARHEAQQKAARAKPKASVPAQFSSAPETSTHRPVEQLTRELIHVAAQGRTVSMTDLENAGTTPTVLELRLTLIDRKLTADTPMLSALVTTPDGDPVPFFRKLLNQVGLAVPQTDQALAAIWRREQERAHAAYGNPPRPLPPRLVPPA
ncbi:hypothetical protein ACFYWS_38925 [Streptomyces sp. NPDC002795]|uniref:hypothetical protein n=1 Tax=Streptomyces sp. NPDC002795 TaxID=3364665 RepID=UPI0036C0C090